MGALFGKSCYADANSASTAAYSVVQPVVTGADQFTALEQVSGVWYVRTYQAGTLTASSAAPALSFAPCDVVDSASDGLALSFLVALVWAMAFWGRSLAQAGREAS